MNTKVAIVAASPWGCRGLRPGDFSGRRNAAQEKDELQSSLEAAHMELRFTRSTRPSPAKTVGSSRREKAV